MLASKLAYLKKNTKHHLIYKTVKTDTYIYHLKTLSRQNSGFNTLLVFPAHCNTSFLAVSVLAYTLGLYLKDIIAYL